MMVLCFHRCIHKHWIYPTLGLQIELVQLMSELYVLLVHPVAAVKVQAVNPKLKFPFTSLLPPNMSDRSQVASAGATVVVAGAGAAVVGVVPDPSQAVGAESMHQLFLLAR